MNEEVTQSKELTLWDVFDTDPTIEKEGVKVQIGAAWFRVARAGGQNQAYHRAYIKRSAPHAASIRNGSIPPEIEDKIEAEVYADAVIKEWGGNITNEKGEPLSYNWENVTYLLLALPNLFARLRMEAKDFSNYRRERIEEVVKNL